MNILQVYESDEWMPISIGCNNNNKHSNTEHKKKQIQTRAGWAAASPGALMQVNASSIYPYYPYYPYMYYRHPFCNSLRSPYNPHGCGYIYNPFANMYMYNTYV